MSDLDQLYQQVIMDHSRMRHGEGVLAEFDGESFQVNPTCGDEATVRVRISHTREGSPVVEELAWQGQGCSISQASLSIMHDMTVGLTVTEVEHLGEEFREMMHSRGRFPEDRLDPLEDAAAFLGASKLSARVKCALLGWMALRGAVAEALTTDRKDSK